MQGTNTRNHASRRRDVKGAEGGADMIKYIRYIFEYSFIILKISIYTLLLLFFVARYP
jgi:hypothetical protein